MPAPSLADATAVTTNNGLRTQYGLILPPGARVAAYVRSSGVQSGDDAFLAQNLVTTLAAGLARARPNMGDFVVCLPGHAESVVDATTFSNALVAGTKIIGVGKGSNTPTFTWAASTAATWVVGVNDVQIAGLRINTIGVSGVLQAINITGADCSVNFCEFICSAAGFATVTVLNVAATALRADISGNKFRGFAGVSAGNIIIIAGASADVSVCDNDFVCPVTAALGHIYVSGAATGLRIYRNSMYNTLAGSTACIAFAAAASDGHVADNRFCVMNNGTASAQGILFGVGSTVKANQNFCTDEPQKSGVLAPAAVAT